MKPYFIFFSIFAIILIVMIASLLNQVASLQREMKQLQNNKGSFSAPKDPKFDLLERKVNGFIGWTKQADYGSWDNHQCVCKNQSLYAPHSVTNIPEYQICWDGKLPTRNNCVVYDIGLRTEAELGIELLNEFGCEVHGFDPSPITVEWAKTFKAPPGYTLHLYGAGAVDGNIKLYEYDWGQVSLFKPYPDKDHIKPKYESFRLPVKRVPTIMKELGHNFVDVLKIDVEGSEYHILQDIIDTFGPTGSLPFDHLLLEFHNFGIDERYGSSPHVNYLIHILNGFGYKTFFTNGYWTNAGTFYPWRYGQVRLCKYCCPEIDATTL